jgi:nicotinate-nucleotide adenylyltransferase
LTTPEKIGILGGTFDPPHWAHLRVAAHFAALFQLDRLLLIPSGNPWQKSAFITPPETRYQLTQAAAIALNRLLGDEGIQIPIEVDRIELDRQGPSYTIDTAIALRQRYGKATHLIWLMGADSLMQIDTWQDWQHLLKEIHLAVARRPEFALTIDPQSELGRFIQLTKPAMPSSWSIALRLNLPRPEARHVPLIRLPSANNWLLAVLIQTHLWLSKYPVKYWIWLRS